MLASSGNTVSVLMLRFTPRYMFSKREAPLMLVLSKKIFTGDGIHMRIHLESIHKDWIAGETLT
jgi:hypothetical protein